MLRRLRPAAWFLAISVACSPTPLPTSISGPPLARATARATARAQSADVPASSTQLEVHGPPAVAAPLPAPEFPTRTTVQEPYLGRNLDLATSLPPYFSSTPTLRREHDSSLRLVRAVADALRSQRWRLEIRTGCPSEYNGNVFVEGRAVVRDSSGRSVRTRRPRGPGTPPECGSSTMTMRHALVLRCSVGRTTWEHRRKS